MKQSIPEYISALSDNDFEVLEEIFCEKYSQMIELYWLIRGYSNITTSLTYDKNSSESLKIEMTLIDGKPKDIVNEITSNIEDDSKASVWNVGKVIHIEIMKDESETE